MSTKTGIILLYHRVVDLTIDPQLLCVSPARFADHLEVLRQTCHPMPVQQLVECATDDTLPDRAVAVTFDDGYADNLTQAAPLLARYDCPAVVFVTARLEDHDHEFWWDELERLILEPQHRPRHLRLDIAGEPFEWDLDGAASYTMHDARPYKAWDISSKDDPTARHGLYRSLCGRLRSLAASERNRSLDELRIWADATRAGRATHRTLTHEQIRELASGELIEIGAHSVTHSVLASQSLENQREEISTSKVRLEEIIGAPVTSFAYPFGGRLDYTPETLDVVRRTGFSLACSNFAAPMDAQTDSFQLPRFIVRNWDGTTLAKRLDAWFSRE